MSTRVLVAMSGGVDSSVAAALLQEQGCEVIGVTLQLWGKDVCVSSGTKLCCSVRDAMDAKAVAKRLGIPHETLDLTQPFRTQVIDYFVTSYAQGLTPNPCIACNDHIKFGELLGKADAVGASFLATGHYARSVYDEARGRSVLMRASDPAKDQSYVLFGLTQAQLHRARFPIGRLSKPEVRRIAGSLGFVTAEKPDSQDVCFVRDRNKDGFLRRALNVGDEPGPIVDTRGRLLGTHRGLLGYTIGQREGLGIATGVPLYVVAMDRPTNRLIVGTRADLLGRHCRVTRINWVSIPPPAAPSQSDGRSDGLRVASGDAAGGGTIEPLTQPIRAQVKIRARHEPAMATIRLRDSVDASVEFDEPQSAITPGQAAVFYDGDVVLGGGWISPPHGGSDECPPRLEREAGLG